MLRNIAISAAISFMPTVSFAQEVFGTLNASLDGDERTWFLTSLNNDSQTFSLNMAFANMQSFTLWGQPTTQDVKTTEGSLLLSFDVMSVGNQMIPVNVSLTYLEDGWKSGWLADEADVVAFSLSELENTDSGVLLEGSFGVTAHHSEPLAGGEIDASRTKEISGTFSATLPPFLIE